MPQYMLLLYGNPADWANAGPQDLEAALGKYMAWGQKPFVVRGVRLAEDAGRVIRSQGGKPHSTDGPYSETKEVLGGYYLIEAADYDEAVKRSLDHPQLEYGGTIEVRELFGQ